MPPDPVTSAPAPGPEPSFVPTPTLPAEVEDLVRGLMRRATAYLEYGSGASTLMAAEEGVARTISVESDRAWAEAMTALVAERGLSDRVTVHWADIGPTRKWGKPADQAAWTRWHRYPLGVWDLPDLPQPDLVLIDGRFRAACLLATLYRTRAPVTALIDDAWRRGVVRHLRPFATPVRRVGRMAVYELAPTPFPVEKWTEIMSLFARWE